MVGVADSYRGEVLRAYVVPAPAAKITPDALLDYLRERLTKYKIPAKIVIAATLPKTGVGKVDKVTLRAEPVS